MPKKIPPTAEERTAARKALKFYFPLANRLSSKVDEEAPSEWAAGLETCIDLLKNDPVKTFADYLASHKAGNE